MKILFATFIISPLTVFACPDLSGSYLECRPTTGHSTGSKDMMVSQAIESGVTTYVATATNLQTNERETATYVADGLRRDEVIIDPTNHRSTIISTLIDCKNDKLNIHITLFSGGKQTGFSDVSVFKSGSQLIIESHSGDENQEGEDKEICE